MGLNKGNTNNPNGRPKGKPNKTTEQIKEILINFIGKNIDDLQSEYDKLEPKEKLYFIDKLLKYIIQANSASNNDKSLLISEVELPKFDTSQER